MTVGWYLTVVYRPSMPCIYVAVQINLQAFAALVMAICER
jgi:hypothetical protein